MQVLGLIPARGGSKGIPGKNIKKLGGKELIRYTIEAALAAEGLTELIVSTEDPAIAEISRKAGAQVPFLRPQELASDTSPTIDTVLHALEYFQEQGQIFDAVCLLQPTTPFRTSSQIEQALERYRSTGADSLISVKEVPHQFNPYWIFEAREGTDYLQPAKSGRPVITRRQELPPAYYRDGSIYITSRQVIQAQRTFYGQKLTYCILSRGPHVNLDTMDDWQEAERIIKTWEGGA